MRLVAGNQRYRHRARLHYHSEVARSNVPTQKLAQIKHLFIEVKANLNGSPSATWTIDLTDGQCVRKYGFAGQQCDEGSVKALVELIMARQGLTKLEKSDFQELDMAITENFRRLGP